MYPGSPFGVAGLAREVQAVEVNPGTSNAEVGMRENRDGARRAQVPELPKTDVQEIQSGEAGSTCTSGLESEGEWSKKNGYHIL